MPLNEHDAKELRDKLKPLIIKLNVNKLTEDDFNTALSIVTKKQKLDILSAIVENDSSKLISITQGLISYSQSVIADSIIDDIIKNDSIDLKFLLSILQ